MDNGQAALGASSNTAPSGAARDSVPAATAPLNGRAVAPSASVGRRAVSCRDPPVSRIAPARPPPGPAAFPLALRSSQLCPIAGGREPRGDPEPPDTKERWAQAALKVDRRLRWIRR